MTDIVLECRGVCHGFGPKNVLHNVSFRIAAGQIVALVGPSGCGKSTLLRAILGTHLPREGEIVANGRRVTRPSRDVGIVYQNYSLYEFLTARDNVAFGPMLDQTGLLGRCFQPFRWQRLRRRHREEAAQMLAKMNLSGAEHQYPGQMSGGMRQRVSVAQSLIMQPQILLLDEPFGALDEAVREGMQTILLQLYQENAQAIKQARRPPYTILIVTHELNEALYVSDRVLGLSQFHAGGAHGATIVYDKAAPVFHPNDPRDFAQLVDQREELRRVVFDPQSVAQHDEYVSYWSDLQAVPGSQAAAPP